MRQWFVPVTMFGAAVTAAPASTLTLSPLDASSESSNGVAYTINTTDDTLNASRSSSGLQRRGIMEFNLSAIPEGSTINSALFDYTIAGYTNVVGGPYPSIQFHGYAGNGVLETSDPTKPFNLLGSSPTINSLSSHQTSFDSAKVQSLLGASSHLGVYTYQETLGLQARYFATDATYRLASERPRLTIDFTPPPAPPPPSNVLVSGSGFDPALSIREYTRSGTLVRTRAVPFPVTRGATEEYVRGIAVEGDGDIHAYNGTFAPYVSEVDPASGAWTHRAHAGLSTVNNVSYGGIAAFRQFVFAPDMATSGAPDSGQAGIVRFNTANGTSQRFQEIDSLGVSHEFINLTMGWDGLLYGLSASSTEGNRIFGYDPHTMAPVKDITPDVGLRAIAVESDGEIYGASWSGLVYKLSSTGDLLDSLTIGSTLSDIDLSIDGKLAVGAFTSAFYLTDVSLDAYTTIPTSVDSVFVSFNAPVPEPTSAAGLMVIAAAALLRRRRARG